MREGAAMGTATEITESVDMCHWIPGARLFSTSDGMHFVIDADTEDYPDTGPHKFIRRATVAFESNPDGTVTDMTPDHTFPPGITAEEALQQIGYTLT
jgi:hypothetical protein